MTVGELTAKLREYPPEMEVWINYEDFGWADIQFVDGPEQSPPAHATPHVTIGHSCVLVPKEGEATDDGER